MQFSNHFRRSRKQAHYHSNNKLNEMFFKNTHAKPKVHFWIPSLLASKPFSKKGNYNQNIHTVSKNSDGSRGPAPFDVGILGSVLWGSIARALACSPTTTRTYLWSVAGLHWVFGRHRACCGVDRVADTSSRTNRTLAGSCTSSRRPSKTTRPGRLRPPWRRFPGRTCTWNEPAPEVYR